MSSEFNFDLVIDRSKTDSLKWLRYAEKDILPMWVADMDFSAPPPVLKALHERVAHGVFGYALPTDQLVASVVEMLEDQYNWKVDPKWIVWLPGLVSGLNLSCRAVGRKDDEIMTATPVYPPFLEAPKLSGRRLKTIDLVKQKNRWMFDFDALENAITPKTRLFILCNPHNPTGRVFEKKELSRLFEICRRHNIVICADEIHCQLILAPDKKHIPLASLGHEFEKQTITLMAPSKTYNLPGLACSFAVIADQQLRRSFKRVASGIVPHVNVLGYAAALAAYRHGGTWLTELLDYLRKNHDLVCNAVNQMPGLCMAPAEATYLAWIDARRTGVENPTRFFEKAGVGLSDGKDFGAAGYVRLNFGCPKEYIANALERMQKALEKLTG